ncbi:PREDICTED: SET and MYND domain-containing protein 4-like [Ceratosolen solmsi marchali]|uniref:SET and MYND domain-containing protein 4-like n=1 Tax=Ceratosolen solmsi marchali TaxID=326594 RepID=A0AAJ6YPV5_9HYME|nr:PREDICTED: SET and MYND domain-containing protein 4-like [Ceratosolen solmsi marchali]
MIQNYITRSQNEKSIKIRSAGNSLFIKKKHERNDHELIWELYTLSIAIAEIDSEELACGYANRSAILKHFGKYKECMKDIDNALKITTSNALRVKLLCRKSRCSLILQNDKQRNFLEKKL